MPPNPYSPSFKNNLLKVDTGGPVSQDQYHFIFLLPLISYIQPFPPVAQQWRIHLQCRKSQEMQVWSQVRKIPWRRARQPSPVFLPGESQGQRSLVVYGLVYSVTKCQTQLKQISMHACNQIFTYIFFILSEIPKISICSLRKPTQTHSK